MLAEALAECLDWRHLGAGQHRNAEAGDRGDAVGVQQGRIPHHDSTPVMAHPGGTLGADVVEQSYQVRGQLVDVVVLDRFGARGTPVAALIGGQHVVAGLGKHRDLVPPGIGQFGEAVGQYHHRRTPLAGLGHAQPHAVGVD